MKRQSYLRHNAVSRRVDDLQVLAPSGVHAVAMGLQLNSVCSGSASVSITLSVVVLMTTALSLVVQYSRCQSVARHIDREQRRPGWSSRL